jgi:hypothetical protein
MRNGRSPALFFGLLTLLVGGVGCEDRSRPLYAAPGDGQGPVITILVPAESATVHRNATFTLGVQAFDPDGVDSVWTTLEPNVNTVQAISGDGDPLATVGYVVLVPAGVPEDTIAVLVRARDVLGDTSAVFVRRLLLAN